MFQFVHWTPVLAYVCALWHPDLTKKLSKDTERVQKCCVKLNVPILFIHWGTMYIWPGLFGLTTWFDHTKHFQRNSKPKHPLHYLLPPVKVSHSQIVLWPTYSYQLPLSKATDEICCHFQEVLVFLMNNDGHVCVCYWVTDCQLLTLIFIMFIALFHFNH